MMEHMQLSDMPQMWSEVKKWLNTRYGAEEGQKIWAATSDQYNKYLEELLDYGGKKAAMHLWFMEALLSFHCIRCCRIIRRWRSFRSL